MENKIMASLRRNAAASLVRPGALALGCAAVLLAGCAGMGMGGGSAGNLPPTVKVTDGVLTDPQGLTLYTFDRDTAGSGKSACNGPCATNWPPLMASPGTSGSGQYTIITRDDGSKQWAYRGLPLYRFAKDAKPGDRTGDNVNNVWHVAKP
ncbi:putative lipoprotein [Cupriavidus taiwanensis]|uniref:Lipoprotein n=2 Tax=Cupriavidus taiwanensis TaxID=164546 RepID=A0A9Q7UWR5_9BURK|nr:putative lipoprotein [Cupriavidus taiwanensis]